MSVPDPFFDWALIATKLRFGPYVVLNEDQAAKFVWLNFPDGSSKLLGSGKTWPDAVTNAVKFNTDIPQPQPSPMPTPAPEGEEFIEEFCQSMRQRDIFTEFLLWYGEKHDADPESYPSALHREEWFDSLSAFIGGLIK